MPVLTAPFGRGFAEIPESEFCVHLHLILVAGENHSLSAPHLFPAAVIQNKLPAQTLPPVLRQHIEAQQQDIFPIRVVR